MKRSMFFWPMVSAATVLVLWLAVCLFMIGIPVSSPAPDESFSAPAYHLLGKDWDRWHGRLFWRLTWYFESAVNGLWRVAPYCEPDVGIPSHDEPEKSMQAFVPLCYPAGGPDPRDPKEFFYLVRVSRSAPNYYRSDRNYAILSFRELLLYVIAIPGAHFAGASFVVALVVGSLAQLLFRARRRAGSGASGRGEKPEEP